MSDLDSVVITFRLNPKRERERRALDYLRAQAEQGHAPRELIAAALNILADGEQRYGELLETQREAVAILRQLQSGALQIVGRDVDPVERGEELSDELIKNLTKIAKPLKRAK